MSSDEQGAKNRRARSREEWQVLVEACEASGKTRREFCEENGVSYETLLSWAAKFRGEESKSEFREVKVPVGEFGRGGTYDASDSTGR